MAGLKEAISKRDEFLDKMSRDETTGEDIINYLSDMKKENEAESKLAREKMFLARLQVIVNVAKSETQSYFKLLGVDTHENIELANTFFEDKKRQLASKTFGNNREELEEALSLLMNNNQ